MSEDLLVNASVSTLASASDAIAADANGGEATSAVVVKASLSLPALGVPDAEAFKGSVDLCPKYSMRGKVSFGSAFKAKKAQEGDIAGDLSSKIDQIRPAAPKYSMIPRSSGITKTKDSPGPGEYELPSTIYGSHPQLPVAGRVPRTNERRSAPQDQLGAEMKRNPAPHDYDVVKTVAGPEHKFGRADQPTAPKYSMRGR